MEINCDNKVEYDQAKRMVEYHEAKTLGKMKDHDRFHTRVWIKNTNPDWSAGVEKYKCRVEARINGKDYYSEHNDESLSEAIKLAMKSLSTRIIKDKRNQRKIRNFKRHELISA